jgi:hypothetical protein
MPNSKTSSDGLQLEPAEQEALTELQSRRTARQSIDELARRLLALEPVLHHRFVNRLLEQVADGKIKRLALFEPPGHAKSTMPRSSVRASTSGAIPISS